MSKFRSNRKTTPKVKDGQVQKKNRHSPTRWNRLGIAIEKAEKGHKHVISKDDIWRFLRLIPAWKRVSKDLDIIYLQGDYYDDIDGWYEDSDRPAIAINPWKEDLKDEVGLEHFHSHKYLFVKLGVSFRINEDHCELQFNDENARAYQLLHIFLHELGHHYFRIIHGRNKDSGTEKFAEQHAKKMEELIWRRYCESFHFQPNKNAEQEH